MRCSAHNRSGFALVMVLWLMTIACAIALQLSLFTRLRVQATRNGAESLQAFYVARAGVERAICELKGESTTVAEGESVLDEGVDRTYSNVELGRGAYTLLAGTGEDGEPRYGIRDECAAINVNTADEQTLARMPGMTQEAAAAVVALRGQNRDIRDVGDLAVLQSVDQTVLFGEDANHNGLLDPNEDDGDANWPPDNADGRLDEGIRAYLTCDSAVRNRTASGGERVDINEAEASELKSKLPGITQQQADSIVEHRKENDFGSIAELLDVKLVEKEEQQEGDGNQGGRSSGGGGGGQQQFRKTDKDALDADAFKSIADLVTVDDDDVLQGRVNVNTAPAQVLACLPGLDESLAAEIVNYRAQKRFDTVGDLLDVTGMSTDRFKQLCNSVDVRSDVFSVRSFGVLESAARGGPPYCCICAVLDRTGDSIRIKSWREPN